MSITSAVRSSLTSPRPQLGAAAGGGNAIADTLTDMLEGLAEIEKHARQVDPRNVALLAKLGQLKTDMQTAAAQAAGAGMARLGATIRGSSSGSTGGGSPSPF